MAAPELTRAILSLIVDAELEQPTNHACHPKMPAMCEHVIGQCDSRAMNQLPGDV